MNSSLSFVIEWTEWGLEQRTLLPRVPPQARVIAPAAFRSWYAASLLARTQRSRRPARAPRQRIWFKFHVFLRRCFTPLAALPIYVIPG